MCSTGSRVDAPGRRARSRQHLEAASLDVEGDLVAPTAADRSSETSSVRPIRSGECSPGTRLPLPIVRGRTPAAERDPTSARRLVVAEHARSSATVPVDFDKPAWLLPLCPTPGTGCRSIVPLVSRRTRDRVGIHHERTSGTTACSPRGAGCMKPGASSCRRRRRSIRRVPPQNGLVLASRRSGMTSHRHLGAVSSARRDDDVIGRMRPSPPATREPARTSCRTRGRGAAGGPTVTLRR